MAAAAGGSGNDLLIIGPGVLGSYAGKLWREAFPGATVVAQTNTTASHERCVRVFVLCVVLCVCLCASSTVKNWSTPKHAHKSTR